MMFFHGSGDGHRSFPRWYTLPKTNISFENRPCPQKDIRIASRLPNHQFSSGIPWRYVSFQGGLYYIPHLVTIYIYIYMDVVFLGSPGLHRVCFPHGLRGTLFGEPVRCSSDECMLGGPGKVEREDGRLAVVVVLQPLEGSRWSRRSTDVTVRAILNGDRYIYDIYIYIYRLEVSSSH